MDAFRQTIAGLDADGYTADPVVYKDPAAEKRHGDGKLFRVRSDNIRIDGSKIRDAISSHAIQVLITNLSFSDTPSENKRTGAPTEGSVWGLGEAIEKSPTQQAIPEFTLKFE